jgi:8-oxo-dGTP pyrophosphatase MutT (NUDIX family)
MQQLQQLAREDGISLTLFPWDKGQVSQSKLTKFYRGQGFSPTVRGSKAMQWTPDQPGVAESAGIQPRAAGCVIVAADTGRWCLQQRSNSVSDPGVWSTWGGGREPGENLQQCVRRELAEESGYQGLTKLELIDTNQDYATFLAHVPREFEPQINHECQDWRWSDPDDLPEPLHPGLQRTLMQLMENFADGKVKGKSRPGRVKRAGASCNGSVTDLRARAKKASGEKARMYHWCANMKSGRNKNK